MRPDSSILKNIVFFYFLQIALISSYLHNKFKQCFFKKTILKILSGILNALPFHNRQNFDSLEF